MTDAQPTLRTERLIIRPFQLADAPAVELLAGDARVAETTANIPHPYPEGMAEKWIATHPSTWAARTMVTFAMTVEDELVGAISLRPEMDHARAELGYWTGVPFWGRGVATEGAAAVIAFGFEKLQLNRIYAHHMTRNPASGRVMQKLGMTYEGCLREHSCRRGRIEDLALYGILRNDWQPGSPVR